MESSVRFYLDTNPLTNNFVKPSAIKILLLGYGKSSLAIKKYYENKDVIIDILRPENKKEYRKFIKELPLYDLCFRSPGIPINKSIYTLARLLSKEFSNELVYALKLTKSKRKIIITGSNGKTSLCLLLKAVLSTFHQTHLYGNIGETLIDKLDTIQEDDFLILEASSFQLEDLTTSVEVGIIKNLQPNHLNATYSLATYYASKKRLKLYSDFFLSAKELNDYNLKIKDNFIYVNDVRYLDISTLKNDDPTFIENILYCLIILMHFNLDINKVKKVFKNFEKVKYRNNQIIFKNIRFVNDAKSTSSSATRYCFSLYKGKRILILGGIHKSDKFRLDFNKDDEVYIYGQDASKIKDEIKIGKIFSTLNEVLNDIKLNENITIIFSPGCASLDQYDSYKSRGEEFDNWVNKWIK